VPMRILRPATVWPTAGVGGSVVLAGGSRLRRCGCLGLTAACCPCCLQQLTAMAAGVVALQQLSYLSLFDSINFL
jgi:hypothetical protein